MSKTIKITDDLSLPLDVVTMRMAIYGTSGSGKTTFARLLAEKIYEAKQRFVAIDLKNDWYGLKSSADGSAAGIPAVIFGGPRRDVQLFHDAGGAVADAVAAIDQPVIVDLDSLSHGKQVRFLTAFLDRLYEVNRRPLLVIADEADRYAPQKPISSDAIMSLSASEDICRRGRKRGIGSFWLTQRTAVLNKNVSDICDMTVVFRTPGSRDLNELEERVGRLASKEHVKEVMRLAPGLEDGQAFFLSSHPKLRECFPSPPRPIQLPLPWTFDSSATPGVHHRRREPKVLAKTDLVQLEQQMASVVADAKANDPKVLKIELAKAQAELKKLQAAPAPKAEVKTKTVERFILKDGQIDKLNATVDRLQKVLVTAGEHYQKAIDLRDGLAVAIKQTTQPVAVPQNISRMAAFIPKTTPIIHKPAKVIHQQAKVIPANGESLTEVPGGKFRNAMIAISQRPGITDRQICIRAGISATSSTLSVALSKARKSGWIRDDGPRRYITDDGLAALGEFDSLPEGPALLQYWLRESGDSAQSRVLQVVADAYPEALDDSTIQERAGISPTSSTLSVAKSKLRNLELIEYPSRGLTKASDELFAE